MGLFNRSNDNKCWALCAIQALKACPSFRNFIYQKVKKVNLLPRDTPYWSDRKVCSFWDSLLFGELRDSQTFGGYWGPGFRGVKFNGASKFGALELPWNYDIFGYRNYYSGEGVLHPLQELISGFEVLKEAMFLMEEELLVLVHWKDADSSIGQVAGPYVHVNALKPLREGQTRYIQVDRKGNKHKERVEVEADNYKLNLNEELVGMSDRDEFTISEFGKLLIVMVRVKIETDSIQFVHTGDNAIEEEEINEISRNGFGFEVCSKMKAQSTLFLQGKWFVLTATVKYYAKKHFVCYANGQMNNVWWSLDDDRISAIQKASELQDCSRLLRQRKQHLLCL